MTCDDARLDDEGRTPVLQRVRQLGRGAGLGRLAPKLQLNLRHPSRVG